MNLTTSQQNLLNFANPTDAPYIAIGLRKVFNMALFDSNNTLTNEQKDDLFYLEKTIQLLETIK